MNIFYITKLPEVTNPITELEWKIDWWKDQYEQSKDQTNTAWKIYFDAINNGDGRDVINELYNMAQTFEAIQHDAWKRWQDAKAQYLAKLN